MDNQTKKSKTSFFSKEYWKTLSWKQILINLAVYLAIYGIMILIDLLTKSKIYDNSANSGIKIEHYQGKIIGTRSVLHKGTTIEIGLTMIGLHILTFAIILGSLFASILFRKMNGLFIVAGFATVAAGATGNMVDRFILGGVRDIFYLPWFDRGTWNFADACLMLGAFGSAISMIIIFMIERHKKDKQAKENENTSENTANYNDTKLENKKTLEQNKNVDNDNKNDTTN